MRQLIAATTILLTATLGPSAQAQERKQFTHYGSTCIERSKYSIPDVLETVSTDTTEFIRKTCIESEHNLSTPLEIDLRHVGHGCPYGHYFDYTLRITCTPK
jgi:hypothetical protein